MSMAAQVLARVAPHPRGSPCPHPLSLARARSRPIPSSPSLSLTSSVHSRLTSSRRERALLDAESQHLEATLAQSESSLEEMQARSAADHAELARELPALRCAFRKRTREGHSNALRLACSLATLESEMGLLGSPDAFSKRAAWASPAF